MTGSITNTPKKSLRKSFHSENGRKAKSLPPVSLRLTWEEKAALKKAAGAMSLSAYMRLQLFGDGGGIPCRSGGKPRSRKTDHRALAHVLGVLGQSRLASNLNQLAKAVHMGALPVTPETEAELQKACLEVRLMREALMNALGLLKEGGRQ